MKYELDQREFHLKSRAKINLFLDITGVDLSDGYHYIDSIFQEITLHDDIILKRSLKDITSFDNAEIPQLNTISTAVRLFKEKFGITESFDIRVKKNIPLGAGLGGGSSNAAAVLSKLASLYKIKPEEIFEIGRMAGSDVPFFFTGGMCRIGGKGEIVKIINIFLTNILFIIVYPDIHISTGWAYSLLSDYSPSVLREKYLIDGSGDVDFLKKIVYNKFQFTLFNSCQELSDIKQKLDSFLDSHLSFMSGSGSSLVFVYSDRGKARHDLAVLHKKYGYQAFLCRPFYRKSRPPARFIEKQQYGF